MNQVETGTKAPPTAAEIQEWMVEYVAGELEVERTSLDVNATFDRLGISSVTLVGMTGAFGEQHGSSVDPALLFDHPTIHDLSNFLAELFE